MSPTRRDSCLSRSTFAPKAPFRISSLKKHGENRRKSGGKLTFRTSPRDFPEFPRVTGGAPSVRQRGSPTGAAPPPRETGMAPRSRGMVVPQARATSPTL